MCTEVVYVASDPDNGGAEVVTQAGSSYYMIKGESIS